MERWLFPIYIAVLAMGCGEDADVLEPGEAAGDVVCWDQDGAIVEAHAGPFVALTNDARCMLSQQGDIHCREEGLVLQGPFVQVAGGVRMVCGLTAGGRRAL